MKHGVSFYISDDAELIGLCGSALTKTGDGKSIANFNFDKEQLTTEHNWYFGPKETMIITVEDHNRECALEVEKVQLNNGGPIICENWCTCTHCGYRHALFIPRNYCPKCGYKFTSMIYKGIKAKEDQNEQKSKGDA